MFFWRNPVGIQSGPSRDPVGTQSATSFCIFGHRFWPVGIQSGSSRAPILEVLAPRLDLSGSSQNHRKTRKNTAKMLFFCEFGCLPTLVPDWIPTGSRLDPDWIPTGQKRCPKIKKIASRRDPDSIHKLARTHSRTYFSLPRPTLAPIFLFRAPAVHQYPSPLLHQNGKSSLKPNGGSTIYIYISLSIYLSTYLSIYIYIYISISISIYLFVFPNRIENVKNQTQATAANWRHFCYAVGLCGWVSVRCQTHQSQNWFHLKPQDTVVVSHV